jgi:hypothetical protein
MTAYEVLELDRQAVMRAAAHEHDAGGEGRRHYARLCGERGIAHAVRNRLRGIRDVDLDVIGPQRQRGCSGPLHLAAAGLRTTCT